jgi:hypothetical protein
MSTPLTSALADAITRQEGFFPGSASYQNNNPGNIMDLGYYRQTGQFKLQAYPTLEAGRAALESLVDKYIAAGHTLTSFFAKYAPSSHEGNDPGAYARNVAGWLGIPLDAPLNQIQLAPPPATPGVEVAGATPADGELPPLVAESGIATMPLLIATGAVGAFLWWWLGD